ncbi:hypothetical protein [Methylobacterium iners]|nr:hypothetical protein [Methylobacterium iners]
MSGRQTYTITALAGPNLAGRRRPKGPTIELTPAEAEYELRAGTIVAADQPLPAPTVAPAVQLTDTITLTRNGAPREVLVSDFVALLRAELGSAEPPEPSVGLDLSAPLSTDNLPVS